MLRAGSCFQVERIIALNAFNVSCSQSSGEEGVLSVCLHSTAPAGIPEDVHVRCPESQSGEAAVVLHFACLVEFGASLFRNDVANLLDNLWIECGTQTYRFRENGGTTATGHSVKGFIPPVVWLDTQPLHSWSAVHHHSDLLVQSHLGD